MRYFRGILLVCLCVLIQQPYITVFAEYPIEDAPSAWAESEVLWAIENGLVPQALQQGYTSNITREQFCDLATLLLKKTAGIRDEEISDDKTTLFDDTDNLAVHMLYENNIIQGKGEGVFAPSDFLTREEAATILSRVMTYLKLDEPRYAGSFVDEGEFSQWADDGIRKMYASGVMMGTSESEFSPKGFYTNEQAILTMLRIHTLYSAIEFAVKDGSDVVLTIFHITGSRVFKNEVTNQFNIEISLSETGRELLAEATERMAKQSDNQLPIYIGGQVVSSPRVVERIDSDSVVITGEFSEVEAKKLSDAIRKLVQKRIVVQNNLIEKYGHVVRNAVKIDLEESRVTLETGASKVGGKPDLPPDLQWFYYTGESYDGKAASRPLIFLAQINCEEMAEYDLEKRLPEKGMLYYFYDMETQPWGFGPKDKGGAKVYYYDGNLSVLKQTDFPKELDPNYQLPEMKMIFSLENSFPSYEEFSFDYDTTDWDLHNAIVAHYDIASLEREASNKLLGYADVIQGEMKLECEQVVRGIYMGDASAPEPTQEMIDESKKWTLLFQMDSFYNEEYEWLFGDSGRLYFYIKENDLKSRNFDNTWCILQCY